MEAFLQTLLTMSATAAVVALVVMVLRLPLKKVPRWVTCALWGVVLLRMVLPAGLSLPVSLVPQGVSSGAYVERVLPAAPAPENGGNTVLADPAPQAETSPQTPVQQATVPDTAPEESSAAPHWPAVVTGIWAAGCGACLLWAALSYWRLRRQVAEAVRVEPGVYETDQIPSPFVCGFFRPRIYLPAGLDVADRTYVLLHEKAHLRRWDHRTKVLGCDYSFEDAKLIVKEMMDLLCLEMVEKNLVSDSVTLQVGYSRQLAVESSRGTASLDAETNADIILVPAVSALFERIANPDLAIHRLNISVNHVIEEEYRQYSMFTDVQELERNRKLQTAMLDIKKKFGKNAILKGINLQEASTMQERNQQIGGHKSGIYKDGGNKSKERGKEREGAEHKAGGKRDGR